MVGTRSVPLVIVVVVLFAALVACAELELRLISPRVTVVAAVRAAAVRIQRPLERHSLHGIERGSAGDFLVAGRVRPANSPRQGIRAACLHQFGDLPGRGLRLTEVE